MIIINIRPAARAGLYTASLGGRDLVTSRQPFLDSARILLQEGVSAAEVLTVRWAESGTSSLTAPIGVAAGLTVWEPDRGQIQFAKWRPRQPSAVAPPVRYLDRGATWITGLSSYAPA